MTDPQVDAGPSDAERRLAIKQSNERVKLTATFLNNLAVGVFVGGLIAPSAAGRHFDLLWYAALTAVAAGLHLTGRWQLRRLQSEE